MPSDDEDYDEGDDVTTETSEDLDDKTMTESDEGGATLDKVSARLYLANEDKSKAMASELLAKRDWLPAVLQREVMEQCHNKWTGNNPTVDNARDIQDMFGTGIY
jgi:hypothetical protein